MQSQRETDQITVASIPDVDLLERAVRSARDPAFGARPHPRWAGVSHAFALGSTFSAQLCRRFRCDPDEQVRR